MVKKTNDDDKCIACGDEPGGLYLWKPKKEWGLKGWLCEPCLKEWEKSNNELKKNAFYAMQNLVLCHDEQKKNGILKAIYVKAVGLFKSQKLKLMKLFKIFSRGF
jgi:hypothetical protein